MGLDNEKPRVLAEKVRAIDDATGFPDAGSHCWRRGLAICNFGAGRIELDDARGGECVLEVVSPDAAIARTGSVIRSAL